MMATIGDVIRIPVMAAGGIVLIISLRLAWERARDWRGGVTPRESMSLLLIDLGIAISSLQNIITTEMKVGEEHTLSFLLSLPWLISIACGLLLRRHLIRCCSEH